MSVPPFLFVIMKRTNTKTSYFKCSTKEDTYSTIGRKNIEFKQNVRDSGYILNQKEINKQKLEQLFKN